MRRPREADVKLMIAVKRDGRPQVDFTFLPDEDAFHVVVYDWRGLARAAETLPAENVLSLLREAQQAAR